MGHVLPHVNLLHTAQRPTSIWTVYAFRGVVLEALGRFDEAVADYRAVLAVAPNDPAGWNNLGNATAGLGRWEEAVGYYDKVRAPLVVPDRPLVCCSSFYMCIAILGASRFVRFVHKPQGGSCCLQRHAA